jgi:hypothetical protein
MTDEIIDVKYFDHHPVQYDTEHKDEIFIVMDDMMDEEELVFYLLQHTESPEIYYKKVRIKNTETDEIFTEYFRTNKEKPK